MANATYAMPPNTTHSSSSSSSSRQPHPLFAPNNGNTTTSNNSQTNMMSLDDRLDAARSLLGISPCSVADSSVAAPTFGGRAMKATAEGATAATSSVAQQLQQQPPKTQAVGGESSSDGSLSTAGRRPRSNSAGLDALAFFATQQRPSQEEPIVGSSSSSQKGPSIPMNLAQPKLVPLPPHPPSGKPLLVGAAAAVPPPQHYHHHHAVITSSSDDDSEAMPPPPPRTTTRRRSMSNPEGMEKYNNYNPFRLALVLPASILEEELAEASAAMKAKQQEEQEIAEGEEYCDDEDVVDDEEEQEDNGVDQDELLRRARSRLLEDLSQGNLNGEKGVLTLPHSLAKYKEVRVCRRSTFFQNVVLSYLDVASLHKKNFFLYNICCRYTTRMVALGFIHRRNEPRSLRGSRASVLEGYGIRRLDISVARTWQIDDSESRGDL